jgi:hypothetical protein
MASIPLPALSVRSNEQSPLDTFAKLQTIKQLMGQQQLQQSQLQTQGLQQTGISQENQQRALQLQDQQTLRSLAPKYVTKDADGNIKGFDFNGFANEASGSGVNPATLQQMTLQHSQAVKAIADADEATRNNEIAKNKQAYEVLEGVRGQKDPQAKQAAYQQGLQSLGKLGVDTSKYPQQVPPDDMLNTFEAGLGMHAQALADAKTSAETNQLNQKARLDQMEANQKGSPLTAMEANPSEMAGDKLPSAMGYLQSKINDPSTDPVDKARATRLLSTAQTVKTNQLAMDASKKATEQAIQDGDPNAAAKLLVDGTVAPAQLISSRKPEFAQKAFTAAQALQPGWSAQKADADFKVASSPANVAFFGSAKSLTDKGGTLDQLKDAGKDIPQNQIPVFNTIADALKASQGSGPIAKYAAIALGVADDYAKVMGGGMGSDTSRNQAIQLISAKQSPEQREASLEGIRGSVGSQTKSRIGANTVLQKMYGGQVQEQQGGGGATRPQGVPANFVHIKSSDGQTHWVPSLEAAKKIDPGAQAVP